MVVRRCTHDDTGNETTPVGVVHEKFPNEEEARLCLVRRLTRQQRGGLPGAQPAATEQRGTSGGREPAAEWRGASHGRRPAVEGGDATATSPSGSVLIIFDGPDKYPALQVKLVNEELAVQRFNRQKREGVQHGSPRQRRTRQSAPRTSVPGAQGPSAAATEEQQARLRRKKRKQNQARAKRRVKAAARRKRKPRGVAESEGKDQDTAVTEVAPQQEERQHTGEGTDQGAADAPAVALAGGRQNEAERERKREEAMAEGTDQDTARVVTAVAPAVQGSARAEPERQVGEMRAQVAAATSQLAAAAVRAERAELRAQMAVRAMKARGGQKCKRWRDGWWRRWRSGKCGSITGGAASGAASGPVGQGAEALERLVVLGTVEHIFQDAYVTRYAKTPRPVLGTITLLGRLVEQEEYVAGAYMRQDAPFGHQPWSSDWRRAAEAPEVCKIVLRLYNEELWQDVEELLEQAAGVLQQRHEGAHRKLQQDAFRVLMHRVGSPSRT